MRRKLLVAFLVFVALLGGGYYLLQWLLVSDVMRTELERQLSAYLQQPVTIKSVRAAIYPRVSIALGGVAYCAGKFAMTALGTAAGNELAAWRRRI